MALSDERLARFSRQLLVPGFGEAAQERLAVARVRAVGVDGASSAALVYLAQAGVGRLWLDEPEQVSPADAGGWIFGAGVVGASRTEVAQDALGRLSRYTAVEPYRAGGVPTAALIAGPVPQLIAAAEVARRAGIPHVVLEHDADGGGVVSVPPGAPCYTCARPSAGLGRPPLPGVAALGALAAAELVQLIAFPKAIPGRRIELVRGVTALRTTTRIPGCACSGGFASNVRPT